MLKQEIEALGSFGTIGVVGAPQIVELYEQGRFPLDWLVKFYPLEQINQAAEDSTGGVTLKPVVRLPH